MKQLLIAATLILSVHFMSCTNDTKNESTSPSTTPKTTGLSEFPKIDTSNLKNEASIFKALTEVLDARAAEEKKSAADPAFQNHYTAYATYYASILNAANQHMDTYKDPIKAVEFQTKITEIEKKYQAKK